jgi:hypothetical protein
MSAWRMNGNKCIFLASSSDKILLKWDQKDQI